jgi:hypothetical protein
MGPHGESDLSLLTALADEAAEAGDAPAAKERYAALLQAHQQVSGPKHPDTLSAQYNKARWTGEAGDAAGASAQMAALRALMEQLYGPDDDDALALGAKHAYWTLQAGDAAAAGDLYAALLPAMFRVLGREHPFALGVRAQFAICIAVTGDVIEALQQFSDLASETERVLGAEHPETFAARTGLAATTDVAGDKAGARQQLAALHPLCQGGAGPSGPDNSRRPRHPLPIGPGTRKITHHLPRPVAMRSPSYSANKPRARFEHATRCLEGTVKPSRHVVWCRSIGHLTVRMQAFYGLASPGGCGRWLPVRLPDISTPLVFE